MKHIGESITFGAASTAIATVAGIEDFLTKLVTSLVIAALAAVVSHYVKHGLARRTWSKKAKELHERQKRFPHEPPTH